MAALLRQFRLIRHTSPTHFDLDHAIDRRVQRPRLIAKWHLGADGRPACIWSEHGGARGSLPG